MNIEETTTYTIDDQDYYQEQLDVSKAMLKKRLEEAQVAFNEININDPWSVFRAMFDFNSNGRLSTAFQEYLRCYHRLAALEKAKVIAESNDDIELIKFSGEYSGEPGVQCWLDHDNQRVMIVTDA